MWDKAISYIVGTVQLYIHMLSMCLNYLSFYSFVGLCILESQKIDFVVHLVAYGISSPHICEIFLSSQLNHKRLFLGGQIFKEVIWMKKSVHVNRGVRSYL